MIVTVDVGTSFTKVALWEGGLVACGRAPLVTHHPAPGRAEQDAATWWSSVVDAAAAARAATGAGRLPEVTAVACCGARQTFVAVDADRRALGPGIVWSDRRAAADVEGVLAGAGGAASVRERTGGPLSAESVAAKVAWLERHDPTTLERARWLLTPRDLVVERLCGEIVTDVTMASRSGLYDLDGMVVDALAGPAAGLLPAVVASDSVVGTLQGEAAAAFGVGRGVPVVVGAGDRACEVLGTGATPTVPMVSWGTTASVVVPAARPPAPLPDGLVVSRSAEGGALVEGGLSAAGALLDWLAGVTGDDVARLTGAAASRPPGSRGVLALPWLGGARAPWWQDRAAAGFVGVAPHHDAGDLARAVVEAVAAEVRRCLRAAHPATAAGAAAAGATAAAAGSGGVPYEALALGGRGRADDLWPGILAAVCQRPVRTRRSGEAASAGAAMLGARAVGQPLTLDELDPPAAELAPDEAAVDAYRGWLERADRVAGALVDLDLGAAPSPATGAAAAGPSG